MCSKMNEVDAEVCAECGARLKPLVIDPVSDDYSEGSQPETPSEPEAEEEPQERGADWLGNLRAKAATPEEPPPPEPEDKKTGELPAWLDRLRPPKRIGAREEGEELPLPDEKKSRGTDWLRRLRKVKPSDEDPEHVPALIEDETFSADEQELARAEIPDWLEVEREEEEEIAETEAEEVHREEPFIPIEELDAAIPEPDVPFDEVEESIEEVDAPIEEADATFDEVDALLGDVNGLIKEVDAPIEEPEVYVEEEESYVEEAEVGSEEAEIPAEEMEAEPIELGELLAKHTPPPIEREKVFEERDKALRTEEIEEPVELRPEEEPEEIPEIEEPPDPQTPALILDNEGREEEPKDLDLDSLHVPEWVGDEQDPDAPGIDPDAGDSSDLAKAVLPGWLERMRPVETFRAEEEVEDEDPKSVETIGPLAGLSGVLSAEPVVAMPRTPGVAAARINITQQENEQVRILRGLIDEEEKEIAPSRPLLRAAPVLHWIVSSILVVAVVLPQLISGSIFPAPRWVPQDLENLRGLVDGLPIERPALVVADYDPGYSAELEALGSSLLDHLFQRGVSVVTLSTRASGPALAQRLIDHVDAWHSVEAGENYLHLGYLSGGPTAVQLFASNPRYGSMRGFMLPEEQEWNSPWEAPILSGVQHLSDFSAVVVVTAGTETARTWAEQAAPQTGETPFIMVLSAGAEPLVRPYYANPDRQVDAIFTGLPSGKANELLNGRNGDASLLWDSFGMGGWASTGVMVIGGLIGIVASVLRGRAKDKGDA
jgi:hypothetical protein